ncbi:hypothetical protein DV737_g5527, partial [Chaetothyriales sp. CBS 132003]
MPVDPLQHGGEEVLVRPPAHPVPSLQGPFEESMVESINDVGENESPLDALTRRAMLLDSPYYERIVAGRWKQKPGEKYHPLWKLVSQMAFGLHLLARNMAKSEEEVMKILQAHVDDIDSFLECTNEDLDLAQSDVHERLRCLKLPLQHGEVFDRMLQDHSFRASILEGNEKIEHIVSRTKRFLRDSLKDIRKGFDATNILERYVHGLSTTWQRQTPEHEAVFVAMIGNVEGWRKAFMELHLQGNKLAGALKKLMEVVNEIARRANTARAGAVSKGRVSQIHKPLPSAPGQRDSHQRTPRSMASMDKYNRPTSAKSHRGQSLESSPWSAAGSTEPPSVGHTPTPMSTARLASGTTSDADKPTKSLVPGLNINDQTMSEEDVAVELPADVPEDILRNAPVSIRNRLSYTLGLQRRDNADHRISSIYYPRALGALLKVPHTPKEFTSAVSVGKKSVTVTSASPQTDSDGEKGSVRKAGRLRGSSAPTKGLVQQTVVRSPTVVQKDVLRKSSILTPGQSPGLSSHPAVMAIVERPPPPVELPVQTFPSLPEAPSQSQEASRSRPESSLGGPGSSLGGPESSLGEPGPEVEDPQVVSDLLQERKAGVASPPSPATAVAADLVATPVPSGTRSNDTTPGEADVYELGTGEEATTPTRTPNHESAKSKLEAVEEESATSTDGRNEEKAAKPGSHAARPSTMIAAKTNEETTRKIIAELEAMVPQSAMTIASERRDELDASRQHSKLPPRTTASNAASDSKDQASPTIQQHIESLNFSTKEEVVLGLKPKALNNRSATQSKQIRPLKLKLTKLDGKMVPVRRGCNQQHDRPDIMHTHWLPGAHTDRFGHWICGFLRFSVDALKTRVTAAWSA